MKLERREIMPDESLADQVGGQLEFGVEVFEPLEESENRFALDIEPDEPASPPNQSIALVAPPLIMGALPENFPLDTILRFLPDVRLKRQLDADASAALALNVTGPDGLVAADTALGSLRSQVAFIEQCFKDPTDLANQLHKRLTGLRGDFIARGNAAIQTLGRRLYDEKQRLDREAADERRRLQAEADRQAREQAAKDVAAAAAAGAPKAALKEMKAAAKVATAPPVAAAPAPVLASSSTVPQWRARLKGTPADATEPNPAMTDLTPAQLAQIRTLMLAVTQGLAPCACFEINWGYINKIAAADKTTFDLPELEAYDKGGVRGKARR